MNKISLSLRFIFKIYNPSFLIVAILLFVVILNFPYHFIPDYFSLGEIENGKGFIWNLFTATLSFSGLMITVLLVSYNFYIKVVRRNTFEFIIENPWLRVMFSSFISVLVIHLLGFSFFKKSNNGEYLALIYFSLASTAFYIIALIPIAIKSLKYSNSFDRIKKIISEISQADVDEIYDPSKLIETKPFEEIENNKVMVLRDIVSNAIRDNDWILPQHVLSGLYKRAVDSVIDNSIFMKEVFCFNYVCVSLRRVAFKNSDYLLINILYRYSANILKLVLEKKDDSSYYNYLDDSLKDFAFRIIDSKEYYNIRENILRDYKENIKSHLKSLNYSDEQLPTLALIRQSLDSNSSKKKNESAIQFWYHLTHTRINTLYEIINYSFLKGDFILYDRFNWQLQELFYLEKYDNLTSLQKDSFCEEVLFVVNKVSDSAIYNKVFDHLECISHFTIEEWIKNEKRYLVFSGLHHYSSILKKLSLNKRMDYRLLDSFFIIAKSIVREKLHSETKIESLTYIIDTAIKLYQKRHESERYKYELQQHLHFINSSIKENTHFKDFGNQYEAKFEEILVDYNYSNFPDYVE